MAILTRSVALALVLTTILSTRASAQEMEVPVGVQLPLFLKVVSFDRQLNARAGGALVIAIAFQGGYRTSAEAKDEALRVAAGVRDVAGLPVTLVAIDLDRDALAGALARTRATLLYVAPLRGIDVKELALVARAAHVTTLTGVVRYVETGLAVGVRLKGDRPRIVINLGASRSEGAEFSAELLKLAQVL